MRRADLGVALGMAQKPVTIVTYRHRPKPKRPKAAQPAIITGAAIVSARRPKKHLTSRDPLPGDPEADERVQAFFARMGIATK